MLGRIVARWPELEIARETIGDALVEQYGFSLREVDQFSGLLAPAWVMTHDSRPDNNAAPLPR